RAATSVVTKHRNLPWRKFCSVSSRCFCTMSPWSTCASYRTLHFHHRLTCLLQMIALHKLVGLLLGRREHHAAPHLPAVHLHDIADRRGALLPRASDGKMANSKWSAAYARDAMRAHR